jgi:hypothetical protein
LLNEHIGGMIEIVFVHQGTAASPNGGNIKDST